MKTKTPKNRRHSIVVMNVKALKMVEHYHAGDQYEASEIYASLRRKYASNPHYDIVLTYDGPFDILFWMLGRKRKKQEKEVH